MGFIKKPKSQVTADAPAPKKGGGEYSFALYCKSPDDEKADKVSGMWKHEGKKGNTYFKGTNKEIAQQFFAFPQNDKKTKQFQGYKLQRRDTEADGFEPIDCGLLVSKKKKDGTEFFACEDEEGNSWLLFTAQPRE